MLPVIRPLVRRLWRHTACLSPALALLALGACSASTQYRNVLNPERGPLDFEQDVRLCEGRQQQDTRASVSVNGLSFFSEPTVSTASVQRCLSARGWRRVDR